MPELRDQSMDYDAYLKSHRWRLFRSQWLAEYARAQRGDKLTEAFRRYPRYRCMICGCQYKTGEIELHHSNYENLGNERLFDVIAVCRSCHAFADFARKFSRGECGDSQVAKFAARMAEITAEYGDEFLSPINQLVVNLRAQN